MGEIANRGPGDEPRLHGKPGAASHHLADVDELEPGEKKPIAAAPRECPSEARESVTA